MAFHLVLFDVDGCTAVVQNGKLRGDELVQSKRCTCRVGKQDLLVEILLSSGKPRITQ